MLNKDAIDILNRAWSERIDSLNYPNFDDICEALDTLECYFKLKSLPKKQKPVKNYSGYDLFNDLVKPCHKCGNKPEIGNYVGTEGKYGIACMMASCSNFTVVDDDNFYKAIEKWNNAN